MLLSMPSSFIRSTIECRQSSFSDDRVDIPERTFSTSTSGIAAGFAAGVGVAAVGLAALAPTLPGAGAAVEAGPGVGAAAAVSECPNTIDMIDPRTLIGLL
jgi:hypothetical protein